MQPGAFVWARMRMAGPLGEGVPFRSTQDTFTEQLLSSQPSTVLSWLGTQRWLEPRFPAQVLGPPRVALQLPVPPVAPQGMTASSWGAPLLSRLPSASFTADTLCQARATRSPKGKRGEAWATSKCRVRTGSSGGGDAGGERGGS